MEIWFLIVVTACIAALINALISLNSKTKLPPGPRSVPIISSILWLRKTSTEMEAFLRKLSTKFGPMVTLPMGSRPLIFISDRYLAHQALVQHGAVFADRPKPGATAKLMSRNQHNVSSASYGTKWRVFRRNLTSQILHPSKAKDFSHARKWALDILLSRLNGSVGVGAVKVVDHFRFSMFCLLVFMCFGDKLDESKIKEVEKVEHQLIVSFNRFQILNFWPWVTKVLVRSRWKELFNMKKQQEEVLIPLIKSRKELLEQGRSAYDESRRLVTCYVDSLLTVELLDDESENRPKTRKLSEEQIVSASSEFLVAGTDTTTTALQWIMANLVKYPNIQAKLYEEIRGVTGEGAKEVGEEELTKMPYLKAIVLEGLRRHPPGHFVLPHAVTQEVELGGYTVPKNAIINFMVAEMGLDPNVWEDPMQFKPERFMSMQEEFDITGSREIKMMPFGAGRRICPGLGLALLHLEYFVANLVWNFKWGAADGYEVDLMSEKQELTILMKNPLHAHISPRILN